MKNLTEREREIIKLFCYKNKNIAEKLCIEKSTVKTHVSRILHKLKAKNKTEALVKANKTGLINWFEVKTETENEKEK